jgi:hypothetical protein
MQRTLFNQRFSIDVSYLDKNMAYSNRKKIIKSAYLGKLIELNKRTNNCFWIYEGNLELSFNPGKLE